MNDYNRGTLSEPCMRLPYGFGGDWASIELGDGTGYVKLSEYEKVARDNDKLREFVQSVADGAYEGMLCCDECRFFDGCYNDAKKEHDGRGCQWFLWAHELGIEVTQ